MRIAIFGTGAVGGYFGGKLAHAGQDVTFIARGEMLAAMQRDGLFIESIDGDFPVQPVQATDDPSQVAPVDVVLVCTKSWHIPEAARSMQPMVGPDTLIVPLLNGIDAPRQLAAILGDERVAGGLCRIIAERTGPGHIQHRGAKPYVAFAERDNRPSGRTQALLEAFQAAGVWSEIPPDIDAAMWDKWIFVSAVGSVGAIARVPIGILRDQPETRQLLADSMREFQAVARALGVSLPADIVEAKLAFVDSLAPAGRPSMQRDLMAGYPSELEAQIGTLVRLGEEAGVATPINRTIYASLLPSERRARGEIDFPNHD